LLRESLTAWGLDDLEYVASQALTELATNAVLHARTDFDVTVERTAGVVRVCVEDRSPRLPVQRSYAVDAATGRGLRLVNRLPGKRVWFELREGESAGAADDFAADWSGDWSDVDDVDAGSAGGALARAA
jgi:signal transduction histidine kinase